MAKTASSVSGTSDGAEEAPGESGQSFEELEKHSRKLPWQLAVASVAVIFIVSGIVLLFLSWYFSQPSTNSASAAAQTVTVGIPGNHLRVDPGGKPISIDIPDNVNVKIPDSAFEKLTHHSFDLAPVGTAFITAGVSILVALIALSGVMKQVQTTSSDKRLEELWQRFDWVVDRAEGKVLDVEQTARILHSIKKSATKLRDFELIAIIIEWFAALLEMAAQLKRAAETPGQQHGGQQPSGPDTSFNRILMTASPDDAARGVTMAARIVANDDSLRGSIKANALYILDENLPGRPPGTAPENGQPRENLERLLNAQMREHTVRRPVGGYRSSGPALPESERARLLRRLLKRA